MKIYSRMIILLILVIACIGLYHSLCHKIYAKDDGMIQKIHSLDGIASLFNINACKIQQLTDDAMVNAKHIIEDIIALEPEKRTYENTIAVFDQLCAASNMTIMLVICQSLELLSPLEDIRHACHENYLKIHQFYIDHIMSNKKLYQAFQEYKKYNKQEFDLLSDQKRYFIKKTMHDFMKEGLALPDQALSEVLKIRKELSLLEADFERNIAQDNRYVEMSKEELFPLSDDFINSLNRSESGLYRVGVDYPTYFRVMENCDVQSTRKKLYDAFNNRAYPVNNDILMRIIQKRTELSRILGYADFATFNIDGQMADRPEKVESFLYDLVQRAMPKVAREKESLMSQISVTDDVNRNGTTIAPWDFMYLENKYKKTHCLLDEQAVSEYFPLEKTIEGLLDIYQQFFNIRFKKVTGYQFWHEDVIVLQVMSFDEKTLLGTLLLDMHPRAHKYSHACHITVAPGFVCNDGSISPDVSIVIANFAKPTDTQPSLLKRSEVQTFFHEFGHALHAILGSTQVISLSGTSTKTDFVELPSQMLEEWLWDKDILKQVSCHYQTGESLPDEMIAAVLASKDITSGYWVIRQAFLSLFSLSCFSTSESLVDLHAIAKKLHSSILSSIVAWYPENHFYAAFGHLTGYGARYYGYLWSKVFALDLFSVIKKHGLLNPVIGKRYVKEVLSKGGAQDPNELLYNFLERKPSTQAFFDNMGLDS